MGAVYLDEAVFSMKDDVCWSAKGSADQLAETQIMSCRPSVVFYGESDEG